MTKFVDFGHCKMPRYKYELASLVLAMFPWKKFSTLYKKTSTKELWKIYTTRRLPNMPVNW